MKPHLYLAREASTLDIRKENMFLKGHLPPAESMMLGPKVWRGFALLPSRWHPLSGSFQCVKSPKAPSPLRLRSSIVRPNFFRRTCGGRKVRNCHTGTHATADAIGSDVIGSGFNRRDDKSELCWTYVSSSTLTKEKRANRRVQPAVSHDCGTTIKMGGPHIPQFSYCPNPNCNITLPHFFHSSTRETLAIEQGSFRGMFSINAHICHRLSKNIEILLCQSSPLLVHFVANSRLTLCF